LGSATPSVESYHNALNGKYALAELTERYATAVFPQIEIIDIKKIVTGQRDKILLSPQLKTAIEESLAQNKQVILFSKQARLYALYYMQSMWLDSAMQIL